MNQMAVLRERRKALSARALAESMNRTAEREESGDPELCPEERAELFVAAMRLAAVLGPRRA